MAKRFLKALSILLISIIIIATLTACKIKTPDQYYNTPSQKDLQSIGNVDIEIECIDIIDKLENNKNISKDGYIITKKTVPIYNGDSVYTVLLRISKQQKIVLNKKGTGESIYIAGINGISEFDFGSLSGWIYYINNQKASVSVSAYEVKDGQSIRFSYTIDYTKE